MSMQQQQLPEKELDAIYKYLSICYDEMTEDEKKMWVLLLSIHDPDFDDDDENKIDE
jgi:hypothetical protein